MRQAVTYQAHAAATAERKRALGVTSQDIVSARNSGDRRTPEKRELLRRMAERAPPCWCRTHGGEGLLTCAEGLKTCFLHFV